MRRVKRFHVLVATDGSAPARAALDTAIGFPWPSPVTASGVVARETRADYRSSVLLTALDQTAATVARSAARALAKRWPGAEVRVVDASPVRAILDEAARVTGDVVVLGWRGHGTIRRMLTGSVSRGVVRSASCAVLMVRRRLRELKHVVIGIDGSPHAQRAVELVARLTVPRRGQVSLVTAVETMRAPSHSFVPADVRASVRAEVARVNSERLARARKDLRNAATTLTEAGWKVRVVVTEGAPLRDLLATVTQQRADLLVIGARGVTGVERLLLGSVAQGALDRSPVPVLVAR